MGHQVKDYMNGETDRVSIFQMQSENSKTVESGTQHPVVVCVRESELSPFAILVLPAYRFYRFIGLSTTSVEFEKDKGRFVIKRVWIVWKILFILIAVTIAAQTFATAKLYELQVKNNTILVLIKTLKLCYAAFLPAFSWSMLMKEEEFCEILNSLQETCTGIRKTGCTGFPGCSKTRLVSTGLLAVCIIMSTSFTFGFIDGQHGASISGGFQNYVNTVADTEARAFIYFFMNYNASEVATVSVSTRQPAAVVMALAAFSFVFNWLGSMVWGGAMMMIILWGLLFWMLLKAFLCLVAANVSRNTLEDIRHFNKITSIIDQYNHAFGWVILTSIVTGAMHFSVNIFQFFSDDGMWYQKMTVSSAFLWFGLMLTASAQVHQTAGDIVEALKARFQAEQVWTDKHGNCVETAQGLMLLLHELQTNSIGFKGLGFFTCTYSFIGTVLSAIATYAIIVIQFQN